MRSTILLYFLLVLIPSYSFSQQNHVVTKNQVNTTQSTATANNRSYTGVNSNGTIQNKQTTAYIPPNKDLLTSPKIQTSVRHHIRNDQRVFTEGRISLCEVYTPWMKFKYKSSSGISTQPVPEKKLSGKRIPSNMFHGHVMVLLCTTRDFIIVFFPTFMI